MPDHGDVDCWIVGSGHAGLIEVCALPSSMRGLVEPGIKLAAFVTRDLPGALAQCTGLEGARVRDVVAVPQIGLRSGIVEVGGLGVGLVSFG